MNVETETLLKLHLFFWKDFSLFIIDFVNGWFINCECFQNERAILYAKKEGNLEVWYLQVILRQFYWCSPFEIELDCMWPI